MFAPYCHTCQSRVLLGTRRIVWFAHDRADTPPVVWLRCFCGTVVDWDAQPPAAAWDGSTSPAGQPAGDEAGGAPNRRHTTASAAAATHNAATTDQPSR